MIIARSDIAALFNFPEFGPMLSEYAEECAIAQLPKPNPNREMYLTIERSGMLDVFIATDDGVLAGFATLLRTVLPHYGLVVSTVESVFVPKVYRTKGAGIGLLDMIERNATGEGLLLSAPVGSQLEGVLRGRRYTRTNTVFFMPLGTGNVTGANRVRASV